MPGGRPKGSVNKLTQADRSHIVAYAKAAGKSPIEVMIDNMVYFTEKGEETVRKFEDEILPRAQQIGDAALIREVNMTINRLWDWREKAQNCAVDAAPYIHPRLANVQFREQSSEDTPKISGKMTPKEAAEIYSEMIANSNAAVNTR